MEGIFSVAISYKLSDKSNMTWTWEGEEIHALSKEHAIAEAAMSLAKNVNFLIIKDMILTNVEVTKEENY